MAVVVGDDDHVLLTKRRSSSERQPPGGVLVVSQELRIGLAQEVEGPTGTTVVRHNDGVTLYSPGQALEPSPAADGSHPARQGEHRTSRTVDSQHSVSVAGVVVNTLGEVLVIQRDDNGQWEPPGGVLERHEEIEAGLIREVYEEAGLFVWPVALTGIYKNLPRGILALVYLCRPRPGRPASKTKEARAVMWLDVDEATHRMTDTFSVRIRDAVEYDPAVRNSGPRIRHHDGLTVLLDDGSPV